MKQMASKLTNADEGLLKGTRHLIHDRNPWFTDSFRRILIEAGVRTAKLPPRSPDLNVYAGGLFGPSGRGACLG